MHQGTYIFNQIISFLSRYTFDECVQTFAGDHRIKKLSCWQQFLVMAFGQLGKRESLRDVCLCLEAHRAKLYHLGLPTATKRSTLQDANEIRDYRIYEKFAYTMIAKARKLYVDDHAFALELAGVVYALDSTTIELCLALFPWAKFRTTKSGIKLHTLIDLAGNIPAFIHITAANVSDVKALDVILFELGAFYIVDRGYLDFSRLYTVHTAGSFFVTRAKHNTKMRRLYANTVTDDAKQRGIRCDQTVVLTGYKAKENYPEQLRRITYADVEHGQYYVFLTNNFQVSALIIADLYQHRWQVELFFKWIKQHLQIQAFWGRSENAVKTQIWVAVATYALVAIMRKKLGLSKSMNEILQIVSISIFDTMALKELLFEYEDTPNESQAEKQLTLEGF